MAHCVVPLDQSHDVAGFDCGVEELNEWLQKVARQHQEKSLSKTFVLINEEKPDAIVGFYALAQRGLVAKEQLPPELSRRLPRAIPSFVLGRLAVSADAAGQGHGATLLVDAMSRALLVSQEVGGPFLFVDAKDEAAAAFYRHFGFVPLPVDPLTLVIRLDFVDAV